jgi:hypothetical protein
MAICTAHQPAREMGVVMEDLKLHSIGMSSTNQPLQALEASIQLARQNYKEAKIDSALQHIKEGLQIDEHNAQSL